MFYAREDAAPVATVDGLVHNAAGLNVDLFASKDLVVDTSE
jgi:hypothetical protein